MAYWTSSSKKTMNQFTPQIPLTQVSEVLLNAMALLESPDRWTKNVYARNKEGAAVMSTDPDACQFCMLGALEVFTTFDQDTYKKARLQLLDVAQNETESYSVPNLNDHSNTKHSQVLQAMTAAVFYALADEG